MLGDIIIAEPNACIAFAGKRVIEQTLNKEVPKHSQSAEFLERLAEVGKILDWCVVSIYLALLGTFKWWFSVNGFKLCGYIRLLVTKRCSNFIT